ncbi:MAG: DUF4267 domain-containing protein [Solirubrobacteraceae bacterium]|jgi:hypothetical protein
MLATLGSALSGVIAVAITLMGARYLLDPRPAAAGFGIPGELGDSPQGADWLAVKATRDIAIAIIIAVLLINGAPRLLGSLMLAIALIPIADGTIVLHSGGPQAIAFGVHWATAAIMLIVAARSLREPPNLPRQ